MLWAQNTYFMTLPHRYWNSKRLLHMVIANLHSKTTLLWVLHLVLLLFCNVDTVILLFISKSCSNHWQCFYCSFEHWILKILLKLQNYKILKLHELISFKVSFLHFLLHQMCIERLVWSNLLVMTEGLTCHGLLRFLTSDSFVLWYIRNW